MLQQEHPLLYVLDGHQPVPIADTTVWAEWFETADRHVAHTILPTCEVSTVFLALDHSLLGPPLLFETMVFPTDADGNRDVLQDLYQERCHTWEQAEAQHAAAVEQFS